MKLMLFSLIFFTFACLGYSANILVIFPIPCPSHHIFTTVLVKALLRKGHHVTMVSPYRMEEKLQNYKEIIVEGMVEYKEAHIRKLMSYNTTKLQTARAALQIDAITKITMESSGIKSLLKSNEKFDLVLLETMLCEALLGFSHVYNAPTVVVNSFGFAYTTDKVEGNSHPYAYVPTRFTGLTDEMTFFERIQNTIISLFTDITHYTVHLPAQEKLLKQYFPNAPPLQELINNVSITLLNAHYSVVETPRPYLPNIIPVGGLHIEQQTLANDLKEFLDEAKHGAIFFSLGTNLKSIDLPKDKLDAIMNTFQKLPERILWKLEDDNIEVPPNVKISKWVPQGAVLAHPNTKAFISHGGLLSITEAVYYGVPFVGVPGFGDQQYNVANAVRKKYALSYNMNNVDEESFFATIRKILDNPLYRENVAIGSSLLREQIAHPLDLGVYWIEHVLKYKGAPHLQNAGVKLSWIQNYLLDVISFLALVCFIVLYINYLVIKICLNFILRKLCKKDKVKSA